MLKTTSLFSSSAEQAHFGPVGLSGEATIRYWYPIQNEGFSGA